MIHIQEVEALYTDPCIHLSLLSLKACQALHIVTSGQSTAWYLTVLVENQGEALFTFAADSTYIISDYL